MGNTCHSLQKNQVYYLSIHCKKYYKKYPTFQFILGGELAGAWYAVPYYSENLLHMLERETIEISNKGNGIIIEKTFIIQARSALIPISPNFGSKTLKKFDLMLSSSWEPFWTRLGPIFGPNLGQNFWALGSF